jgi:hypothetical protein
MAVLTWRNVDSPSTRGTSAIDGLSVAAQMLNQGTNGLSTAIGQFGTAQTDLANNAAVAAASRFQDPASLKAALADGSLLSGLQGVDPSRVDARTITGLGDRVSTLLSDTGKDLSNQTTTQNLYDDRYKQGRLETENLNLDASRPAIAAMAKAANARDPKAFAAAAADPSIAKLTPDQIMAAYTKGNSLEQERATLAGTDLQNTGTGISNNVRQFEFSNAKRDDADRQSAMVAASTLSHAADPTEALTQYNQLASQLSPGAATQVRAALEQRFGPIFGGGAAGGVALPGSAGKAGAAIGAAAGTSGATALSPLGGAPNDVGEAGTKNGGMYNVTYQYKKTDTPITSMSIDDLTKDGGLQDTMQKTQGNSPIGAYQINRDTLKDYAKRLGLPPTQIFTPEVQDQLGEAIYNDRRKGDLSGTWSSLKDVQGANVPGAFKNVSWAQAKKLIADKEGTSVAENNQETRNNVTALISGAGQLTNLMQAQIDHNTSSPSQKAFAAGVGVTSDASTEADRLINSIPAFKGANVKDVTSQIQGVMAKTGLNERAAATMLANAVGDTSGLVNTLRSKVGHLAHKVGMDRNHLDYADEMPSGLAVDTGLLAEQMKGSDAGGAALKYNQTQRVSQLGTQITAATKDLQTAADNLGVARQRAAADPEYKGLARYQGEFNRARQQLELLKATAVNDASVNLPKGFGAPKS